MKDRVYLSENELLTKGQELLGKSLYDLYGELSKKEYKGKTGQGRISWGKGTKKKVEGPTKKAARSIRNPASLN